MARISCQPKLKSDKFFNRVNACVNIFKSRVNVLLTHILSADIFHVA